MILYFSGTGNSLAIARKIVERNAVNLLNQPFGTIVEF